MKHSALALALGLSFGLAPLSYAHHQGHCYVSENDSHLCVIRTGQRSFAVAHTNGRSVKPTVLAFDCAQGWNGFGALPKQAMAAVVNAVCTDNKLSQTSVLTASY